MCSEQQLEHDAFLDSDSDVEVPGASSPRRASRVAIIVVAGLIAMAAVVGGAHFLSQSRTSLAEVATTGTVGLGEWINGEYKHSYGKTNLKFRASQDGVKYGAVCEWKGGYTPTIQHELLDGVTQCAFEDGSYTHVKRWHWSNDQDDLSWIKSAYDDSGESCTSCQTGSSSNCFKFSCRLYKNKKDGH